MILTLAWKEYREHRSIWLTMVLLTGVFAFAVARFGSITDGSTASRVALAVLGLAGAYGIVCGSMMLAGEHEGGTLVFLDVFLGRRGLLWLWKGLVGVAFVLAEGLAVALVLHFLKEVPPDWLPALIGQGRGATFGMPDGLPFRASTQLWFWVLPALTLEAYAWGLLGSALTRRALSGAGVAILLSSPCWVVVLAAPPSVALALRAVLAAAALVISLVVFRAQARDTALGPPPRPEGQTRRVKRLVEAWDRYELERRAPRRAPADAPAVEAPVVLPVGPTGGTSVRRRPPRPLEARSPGQVLGWLIFRQAWVLLGILAGAALLVGLFVPSYGQVLWPAATLLLGVACGTATFAQEQSDLSYQFLAAQHFPLKTVWNVKALFWSAAAVLLTLLLVAGGTLKVLVALLATRRPGPFGAPSGGPGFEFGTLRQILGPALFFGVWLVYGFGAGQVCVLLCRKNVLAVLVGGLVAAAALVLWLPSVLCLGMSGWQLWVPPLVALAATRSLMRAWAGGRIKERRPLVALAGFGLATLAWAAVVFAGRAWEIPDVGEPLDRLAYRAALPTGKDNVAGLKMHEALLELENPEGRAGAWLAALVEATALPPGVLEPPRRDGQAPVLLHLPACRTMTNRLRKLADQALADGKPGAALDHLAQLLALSRTLRNRAPLASYLAGVEVEESALHGVASWLAHGRPAPELLRRALDELNRHAAETPPALDCLEAECYRAGGLLESPPHWAFHPGGGARSRLPETWLANGIALSLDTPWEDERKTRLWQAVWGGLFRALRTPYWQFPQAAGEPGEERETTRQILSGWLPVADGPGAPLTRDRLARLLDDSWLSDERLFAPAEVLRAAGTRARWRADATRLAVALGLYQLREGKPARRLEDLVPKDLPTLPVDPYSGQAFRYRISQGEEIEVHGRGGPERALAGQGVVWSTGPDRVDHGGRRHAGDVPDDDPLWVRREFDLVTVVPRWP